MISPKFIFGSLRNTEVNSFGRICGGNWDSFVKNSRFNLKEIEDLNQEYMQKEDEKHKSTQDLGKETIELNMDKNHLTDLNVVYNLVGKLRNLFREKITNRGEQK